MIKLLVKNKDGEFVSLPMYKDENIFLTSKVTDSEDISAVFNDISTSFSIPASDEANEVFQYAFEIGMGTRLNKAYDAVIEIDGVLLRYGKVYIENIDEEYNVPVNYSVSFAGNSISLDEKFGEDTLKDLDFSYYDFPITNENLKSTISHPGEVKNKDGILIPDVIVTPLMVVTDRNLIYSHPLTGGDSITKEEGSLLTEELRPAMKLSVILDAIKDKYELDFYRSFDKSNKSILNKDFLDFPEVANLYLWLNGSEDGFNNFAKLNPTIQDFTELPSPTEYPLSLDHRRKVFNTEDDYLVFKRNFDLAVVANATGSEGEWNVDVRVSVVFPQGELVKIHIYDDNDNILYEDEEWKEGVGLPGGIRLHSIRHFFDTLNYPAGYWSHEKIDKFKIKIVQQGSEPLRYSVWCESTISLRQGGNRVMFNRRTPSDEQNMLYVTDPTSVPINNNLPDIKISDLFKGIMQMFRLILLPIDENSFYLNTLNDYLNNNEFIDINPYIDFKNKTSRKKDIYREVSFLFEESDLVLQKYYRERGGKDYGDLKLNVGNEEGYDGELKIEVPFTNLLLSNISILTGDPVIAGLQQELDGSELSPSLDGIFLFYKNGTYNTTYSIWFNRAFSTNRLIDFNIANRVGYEEINSLSFLDERNPNPTYNKLTSNLYINYWKNWIDLTYNNKYRVVEVKGILPTNMIDKIKLDSKVIVGNDAFNIDDYKINLLTGEVEFKLFPYINNKGELDDINYAMPFLFKRDPITSRIRLPRKSDWKVTFSGEGFIYPFPSSLVIKDDNIFVFKTLRYMFPTGERTMYITFEDLNTGELINTTLIQQA